MFPFLIDASFRFVYCQLRKAQTTKQLLVGFCPLSGRCVGSVIFSSVQLVYRNLIPKLCVYLQKALQGIPRGTGMFSLSCANFDGLLSVWTMESVGISQSGSAIMSLSAGDADVTA